MTIGDWLLVGMAIEYLLIGGFYGWGLNWPMALVMLCYGVANIGLVWTNIQ